MSKDGLTRVVQRAISDGAFRRQLSTDPTGALRGFDLTAGEVSAIRSGDAARLASLGIDQRMSKVFTLGGGATDATRVAGTDLAGNARTVVGMGGETGATGNALVSGDPRSSDALIPGADRSSDFVPSDPGGTYTADAPGGEARVGNAFVGSGQPMHEIVTSGDEGGAPSVIGTDASGSAHTYSGDDLAGPGYGLDASDSSLSSSTGGADAPDEAPEGPFHTP